MLPLFLQFLVLFPWSQDCSLSGRRAWNDQLINVLPNCEVVASSPDGRRHIQIDAGGRISVAGAQNRTVLRDFKPVDPPAMFSWAPNSQAFFVNDGEGSGQNSVFRMFRISGDQITEDFAIHRAAVTTFRAVKKCESRAADPAGSFISLAVSVEDGKVVERLSESRTRSRFYRLLPSDILKKEFD